MSVKLENVNGSGAIAESVPINFSYSEDVTTLTPSTLDGGSGQISVSAIAEYADKDGNTHPNSSLLINNQMKLSHDDGGAVYFNVKQATVSNGVVSIIGDTIASRLNVDVTAGPYGSGNGSYCLLDAIQYYCSLVGLSTDDNTLYFDPELETEIISLPVNFIGWKGNLWEHLKMLCSASSVQFEMYSDGLALKFRKAKSVVAPYEDELLSEQSLSVNSFNAAKEVTISNYNTEYKIDSVVHDINVEKNGLSYVAQNVTLSDALQVNAGETLVRRFTIDASLEYINQPEAVDAILPLPYESGLGQYCMAGSDGLLIKASQWLGEGGSLTVTTTENPREIELTIVAPPVPALEQVGGTSADLGYAPYKVGVEIADGQEYPAIYITGTGVFYRKTDTKILTGASDTYTSRGESSAIDNLFITNATDMYSRGVIAAQDICGPTIELNESVPTVQAFGSTPGSVRTVGSNKYRLRSVSYSENGTSIIAEPSSSFSDFNAKWDGALFGDFSDTALDPAYYPDDALKFNEFTVIPLMEGTW